MEPHFKLLGGQSFWTSNNGTYHEHFVRLRHCCLIISLHLVTAYVLHFVIFATLVSLFLNQAVVQRSWGTPTTLDQLKSLRVISTTPQLPECCITSVYLVLRKSGVGSNRQVAISCTAGSLECVQLVEWFVYSILFIVYKNHERHAMGCLRP